MQSKLLLSYYYLTLSMYALAKNCIAFKINREPDLYEKYIVTHFKPIFCLYTSEYISQPHGFGMFSGDQ